MSGVRIFHSDGEVCDECRNVGPGQARCGCLQEGWYWEDDPNMPPEGPFETEAEALADAGADPAGTPDEG